MKAENAMFTTCSTSTGEVWPNDFKRKPGFERVGVILVDVIDDIIARARSTW